MPLPAVRLLRPLRPLRPPNGSYVVSCGPTSIFFHLLIIVVTVVVVLLAIIIVAARSNFVVADILISFYLFNVDSN